MIAVAAACSPQQPPPAEVTNHGGGPTLEVAKWSAPVNGVRARLIATRLPDRQTKIELELENVTDVGNPLEMWFDDPENMLMLAYDGEAGPGKLTPMAGNHMSAGPYWLMLPYQSSLRMTISTNPYEDHPGSATWFRPMTFQSWEVLPGRTFLRGTLAPPAAPHDPQHSRPWEGKIELPPIELPPR